MNPTTTTKKNIIVEIVNSLIKEEKSILLDTTKISNTHQNSCIRNVLMQKLTKPLNKLTTPT